MCILPFFCTRLTYIRIECARLRPSHDKNFVLSLTARWGAESRHSGGLEPVTVVRQQPLRLSLWEVEEKRRKKEFVRYVFKFVSEEGSCTCYANYTAAKKIDHNEFMCMRCYYVATIFLSLLCMYVSLPDCLWPHTADISLVTLWKVSGKLGQSSNKMNFELSGRGGNPSGAQGQG